MGTMRLECPLCCTETFSTPTDLKYHLLNMVDNLLCTGCARKFDTVRELAEHVAGDCLVIGKKEVVEGEVETKGCSDADEEKEDDGEKVVKEEVDGGMNEESEEVNEAVDVGEMFLCSACNISFQDLDEHVKTYHFGQNVYFEEEVSDVAKAPTETLTILKEDKPEVKVVEPLQVEEFIDKAGRPYTRKVVQIDKFWSETDTPQEGEGTAIELCDLKDGEKLKSEEEAAEQASLLNVYQCTVCSLHFAQEKLYQEHKCEPVKFECTMCDASFLQRRSLSAHMRMHTNMKAKTGNGPPDHEGPFLCDFCSTPFTTFKSLKLHQRMHDPVKKVKEVEPPVNYGIMGEDLDDGNTERVMFTCKVCNKEYDEVYRCAHMKFHSQDENFDCDICNRKFYTQSNLEMHMRVHTTGKPQTCNYCKQEFADYKSLQQHVKTHIESRPYQCQYCTRRFFRPHEKVKHERIHTGEKPHVCQICGKSFRVSYCLTLHMRTHSGSRPYQCLECGKRFKAHSVYNHHLLIHSSERKYKCPYCPKAFKTAVQLAGHKNTHTKPFSCTECNRPFASLYAVRSHMETHKQENNLKYHCSRCGASYARAFALRDHIKAHHDDDQWEDLEQLQENSDAATSIISTGDDASMAVQNVLILGEELGVETVEMTDGSQGEEVTFMET